MALACSADPAMSSIGQVLMPACASPASPCTTPGPAPEVADHQTWLGSTAMFLPHAPMFAHACTRIMTRYAERSLQCLLEPTHAVPQTASRGADWPNCIFQTADFHHQC